MTDVTYKVMSIKKYVDNNDNTVCEVALQGVQDTTVINSFMALNLTDATAISFYEGNLGKQIVIQTGVLEATVAPTA